MKPLPLLVIILGAILAAMGIIFNAPPYIDEPVRVMLGLGFAGALTLIFRGPIGQAIAAQLKGESGRGRGRPRAGAARRPDRRAPGHAR